MIGALRVFFAGINNIIFWLPIIWRDRDWDDSFFFEVVRHKLKSMERYFGRKNPIVVDSHKMAKNIQRAVLILDRICANDYCLNETIFHEKKWGTPKIRLVRMDEIYERFDGFDYPNAITEELRLKAEWERRHVLADSMKSEQYDIEYLFYWLKRHIRCWWD